MTSETLSVLQMFAAQAELCPDNPAVVTADGMLTYGRLQTQSNQLARALQERGAGTDTPVGVCL